MRQFFGDLIDIGAFHQTETYICVPEAVGRSGPALTIQSEVFLVKDGLEKLALPFRKDEVRGLRKAQILGAVLSGFRSVSVLGCVVGCIGRGLAFSLSNGRTAPLMLLQ